MGRDKLIQMISELIVQEAPDKNTSPMEFYNHWVQKYGIKIESSETASWLLDFIKLSLSSDRDLLSYFV